LYFITPFIFEEVSIRNKLSGNTVTIRSVNFDGSTRYAFASGTEQEEYGDIWMQSATLKEQPYLWNWLQVGLSGCAAAHLGDQATQIEGNTIMIQQSAMAMGESQAQTDLAAVTHTLISSILPDHDIHDASTPFGLTRQYITRRQCTVTLSHVGY